MQSTDDVTIFGVSKLKDRSAEIGYLRTRRLGDMLIFTRSLTETDEIVLRITRPRISSALMVKSVLPCVILPIVLGLISYKNQMTAEVLCSTYLTMVLSMSPSIEYTTSVYYLISFTSCMVIFMNGQRCFQVIITSLTCNLLYFCWLMKMWLMDKVRDTELSKCISELTKGGTDLMEFHV